MQQIAPEQLAATLPQLGPEPVLLDVREDWEFATASVRVPGMTTLHIPMSQIPARLAEIPGDRAVVCLCHHGMRSWNVASFLVRQGREAVYNLDGGIDAWSAQVDPSVPRY